MTYQELISEYFVLAPLKRAGKSILLCKNIESQVYDFFMLSQGKYINVEPEIETELRKTYRNINSDVYSITCSSKVSKYSDVLKLQISKAEVFVKKALEKADMLTRMTATNRINNLQVKHFSEDINLTEAIDGERTPAYYRASENTIYFADESSIEDLHILVHELLHCASKHSSQPTVGMISATSRSYYKAPKHELWFHKGRGLNEGATEYYASKALGEDVMAYGIQSNIFANIREVCNPQFVDMFFFTNKPDQLFTHISTQFHYPDNYMIEKLVAQVDALSLAETDDVELSPKIYQDFVSLSKECYKTLIDMYIHKYTHENIDISDKYLFENFLSAYGLEIDQKIIDEIMPDLEIYFALKQYCPEDTASHLSREELEKAFSNVANLIADNKKISGQMLPEALKTPDFYNIMLSDWTARDSSSYEEATLEVKQKVFKTLLSEEFLPKDPQMQEQLVYMVLSNIAYYENYAHRYFPPKVLMTALNKRPDYAIACFADSPSSFFPNLVCGFSPKIKSNPKFLLTFMNALKKCDPNKAYTIIKNFYDTLPASLKKDPTMSKFLAECMIDNALTKENQNQVEQFLNSLDTIPADTPSISENDGPTK